MRSEDTIGRIATSRYTSRVLLMLMLVALFALVADPVAACDCEEFPDACDGTTLA
ncbi:MAG: hypothetical protein ABEI75_01890 [Halobaculum sp.]